MGISVIRKAKDESTNQINAWKPKANSQFPQGSDYYSIPLHNGTLKRLSCMVIPNSKYYRLGFKFLLPNASLFGDTTIKSLDHNIIIHTGGTSISDLQRTDLLVCLYVNGQKINTADRFIKIGAMSNYMCELFIDDESFLHFLINESEVEKIPISKSVQGRVYMLAWGDHNEFELEVKNIEIEVRHA